MQAVALFARLVWVILKSSMLKMSSTLKNQPILSLRSGSPIATALEPIINPNNLKILGWWCRANTGPGDRVLLAEDVREVMPRGLAVNDEMALSEPADLARHAEVLKIHWQLIDKQVKTKRHKLGKVSDYSYDSEGLFVQKLYVAGSLVKVFSSSDTSIIDRIQILEVTDSYILVRDTDVKATEAELAPAIGAVTT